MNAEAGSSGCAFLAFEVESAPRSWQFFQQGTTPLDTQRRQLELSAEHVLPVVR
jgi:hypothetical protein